MDAGNAFVILARKRRSSKETYTVDGRERTDWRREKSTKEIGEFARSWLALLLLMWWLLKEPFVR